MCRNMVRHRWVMEDTTTRACEPWCKKGLRPFVKCQPSELCQWMEGHISTDLTISQAIFSDLEPMDTESVVTYPLSFLVSVQQSHGAKVLTFTNLTSDSLSLYQDPKNAGAVFQVPFSDFDCYGNEWQKMPHASQTTDFFQKECALKQSIEPKKSKKVSG